MFLAQNISKEAQVVFVLLKMSHHLFKGSTSVSINGLQDGGNIATTFHHVKSSHFKLQTMSKPELMFKYMSQNLETC